MVKKRKDFEILYYSDPNFEEMTMDIRFKGEQIAQLNAEKGFDNLEIEFDQVFTASNFVPRFYLDDLIHALLSAREGLLEYRPLESDER